MRARAIRPIFILLGIAFFLTSCAQMCGRQAYDDEIRRSTQSFTFRGHSPIHTWHATTGILNKEGFDPDISVPPLDEAYLTPWRGERGHRSRVSVRIIELDRHRHRLQIHRLREYHHELVPAGYDPFAPGAKPLDPAQIQHETRVARERDHLTEWAVIQAVAPDEALLIEGEARRRQEMTQAGAVSGCR